MLTKPRYSVKDMLMWTRWEIALFTIIGAVFVLLFKVAGLTFLHVPWTPIAVIGTAVAFMIGFQNNAAYGRIWEARQIWGGIVNESRSWGMKVKDMVTNEYAHEQVPEEVLKENVQQLVYRHLAWLTALRYDMRQPKNWETFEQHRTNREWSEQIHIPEKMSQLEDELFHYLPEEEWHDIMEKSNKPAAILYAQSAHLRKLKEKGLIWEFSFLELENLLQQLFTLQGKSERIKNFPYPRQYATLSFYFVWMFLLMLPLGIVPEFDSIGNSLSEKFDWLGTYFDWFAIPFYTAVSWVFHTMQRIGTVGENPFEGSANDVPISTISRAIEIDLRQLIGEPKSSLPKPMPEVYSVQM